MEDIYYQTILYSDDEIKERYISAVKSKNLEAVDEGFVEHISNKANITVKRAWHREVLLTCDMSVSVSWSASKLVTETTGYTVTKRTDVWGLDDYKVSENTKTRRYTESDNYTTKFYGMVKGVSGSVDKDDYFCTSKARFMETSEGYSQEMPEIYRSMPPFSGLTYGMKQAIASDYGCSEEVETCRKEIAEVVHRNGYTLNKTAFKSASIMKSDIAVVKNSIDYSLEITYEGKDYSCEFGAHGERLNDTVKRPNSKKIIEEAKRRAQDMKKKKRKALFCIIPAILLMIFSTLLFLVLH